ncbi:hypothetical protein JCM11641_003792 [Rhodosporidiobolus odoratus]
MLKRCTRCLKPFNDRLYIVPTPALAVFVRQLSSSSSSPPLSPSTPPTQRTRPVTTPRKRSRPPATTSAARPQYRSEPYTPSQTRDRLVDLLATGQPREALRLFNHSLSHAHETATPETPAGHAWLFLHYRQPLVAFQAVKFVHEKGYAVPPSLAAKLLHDLSEQLDTDAETLVNVLAWFSEGMVREKAKARRSAEDDRLLETVMSALRKIGRGDWLAEVFRLYRDVLGEAEVGSSRLWSLAIASRAEDGAVGLARSLLQQWRAAYLKQHGSLTPLDPSDASTPELPSGPYLALLHHFTETAPPLPGSRDPAYQLLGEMKRDGLPSSTALLNALLRLESKRNRFSSFWGLWQQFDVLGLDRSPLSWSLAAGAKLRADRVRHSRKRGRLHNSPLLSSAPFPYTELHTPTSRSLFRTLLSDHLTRTSHRPARHLAQTSFDCLSPSLLNTFLNLFITRSDWSAAAVVLETFSVHRLEPDARTHGSVVVGVVKQWERGKLAGKLREEQQAMRNPYGAGSLEEDRRKRQVQALGGPESIGMIREILEGRKVRAGLWSLEEDGKNEVEQEQLERGDEGQGLEVVTLEEEEEEEDPFLTAPPEKERLSEMRNLRYLVSLLRRSAGLHPADWTRLMETARKEMLPEPKEREEGDEKDKRIDRQRRWEHYAYGASLRR